MFSSINSFGVSGIGGYGVEVEVYISNGLPGFDIVGLPDAAVKEARERVRAAIKNNGFRFPVSRLTVNLAPADKKKAGRSMTCRYSSASLPPLGTLTRPGTTRPLSASCPCSVSCARFRVRCRWRLPRHARVCVSCLSLPRTRTKPPLPRI